MAVVRFAAVAGEDDQASLTPAERGRAARFLDEADRSAYVSAHLLARACVGELLGRPAEDVVLAHRCARCGGVDHGAPYVVGEQEVGVSLSHARGLVAAVAARGRCGIDVERAGAPVPRDVLSPEEVALVEAAAGRPDVGLRLWVRKEAVAKASGQDLTRPTEVVASPGLVVNDWASDEGVGAWAVEQVGPHRG